MSSGCAACGQQGNRRSVYQLLVKGQPPKTYLTEADARAANSRTGGHGSIIRTTQDPK